MQTLSLLRTIPIDQKKNMQRRYNRVTRSSTTLTSRDGYTSFKILKVVASFLGNIILLISQSKRNYYICNFKSEYHLISVFALLFLCAFCEPYERSWMYFSSRGHMIVGDLDANIVGMFSPYCDAILALVISMCSLFC